MISDVLSDAVAELDNYLGDDAYADNYTGALRLELVALRDRMDAMRARLDTAPAPITPGPLPAGFRVVAGELRYSAAWL